MRAIASLLILLVGASTVLAQRRFDERAIKATYLFNFAQFVDWPPASFADDHAPLVIGVLGDDPFGRVLDDVVAGEAIKGRPLSVVRFHRIEDVRACQILFIASASAPQFAAVFEALHQRPILTVGDAADFATAGGMVRFVTDQNRVRLQINLPATRAAGVVVSSRLLRAADVLGAGEVP